MAYSIRGIPHEMVDKVWRWAEPYVQRALDHTFGEISSNDVLMMCRSRDMQLWMCATENGRVVGAGTTQIIHYPQMQVVRVVTMAGSEYDAWHQQAYDVVQMWALENGCTEMEAYVRAGFIPKLKAIGFKHRYSVAHKKLRE